MWPQIRGSDCQIEQQQESRKFEKQCKQQFLILLLPRHCPGKCDKNEKQTKNALKALVQKRGGGGGNKNRDDCDWNEYTDQCNAIISSSLLALLCLPHSCDCDCAWVLVPGSPTMTGRVSLGKEGRGGEEVSDYPSCPSITTVSGMCSFPSATRVSRHRKCTKQ